MSVRKRNPHLLAELAVAIASGRPVSKWAAEKGIAERTAYDWAGTDEVKARVREIRTAMSDAALGVLVKSTRRAASELVKLVSKGQTEQTRLAAARAILADVIAVSSWSELSREVDELKAKFKALEGGGQP